VGGGQEALQRDFDPDRVPDELSDIVPWAVRLGVGDDVCQSRLVEGLTSGERTTLRGHTRHPSTPGWTRLGVRLETAR
jgi:hypothetical protein